MKGIPTIQSLHRVFLDTAPVIYYVENHPKYSGVVECIFEQLDAGAIHAVTSPITLAECLVIPYRNSDSVLQKAFVRVIARGSHTTLVSADEGTGRLAAELRARYGLSLSDALQAATAIITDCDALLTNDFSLKRVAEMNVLLLDELISD